VKKTLAAKFFFCAWLIAAPAFASGIPVPGLCGSPGFAPCRDPGLVEGLLVLALVVYVSWYIARQKRNLKKTKGVTR
jgi:hypothetical protein